MDFSNFVCMAFWLKCFRPEPYKSKSVYFSANAWYTPPVAVQSAVLAGTEPCGILGGVPEVSLRADIVTVVDPPLVPAVGIFILQIFTMPSALPSPQLPLLVSLLRRAPLLLWKIHRCCFWSIGSIRLVYLIHDMTVYLDTHSEISMVRMYKHFAFAKRCWDTYATSDKIKLSATSLNSQSSPPCLSSASVSQLGMFWTLSLRESCLL